MKALILSANLGGGHNAAANALSEALQEMGVETRVMDSVAFGGAWLSKTSSKVYEGMVRHVPSAFGMMYRSSRSISHHRVKSPVYVMNSTYAFRMKKVLKSMKPDLIICTHIFASQSVTHLIHNGDYRGIHAMIMTDYTVHPFTEDAEVDVLYMPHEALLDDCRRRHLPEATVRFAGIPVSLACQPCEDKKAAKRAVGLDENGQEVLLVGGAMGAGNIPETVAALVPILGEKGHLTVVCGNNDKLREAVAEKVAGNKRVTVRGRVVPLTAAMAAADVLVTKPGGLTSTEAMTIGTPMVIVNPIAGCETDNAAFFEKRGMALCAHSKEELATKVELLLQDEDARQKMVENQHREIPADSARQIARELVEMVWEHKGHRPMEKELTV